MIALLIFISVALSGDCDGEVTSCNGCVASSETFAQCQWCSSNGNCNGKYDVVSDCPSGEWLSVCPAATAKPSNAACTSAELAQLQSSSSMCANTNDACAGTACAVYLAKSFGWSASCLQSYQTACSNFGCSSDCAAGSNGFATPSTASVAASTMPTGCTIWDTPLIEICMAQQCSNTDIVCGERQCAVFCAKREGRSQSCIEEMQKKCMPV